MVFYHNINPVLFSIGPFEIRYYGLIFVLGFIITYYMLIYFSKKKFIELNKNEISDLLFYSILGVIIGSRLIYVLFYNLSYFISNPIEIFYLWQGGLSFHGGLLGTIVAIVIYRRKKKFNIWRLGDAIVIPLALALGFGRIANFINGELYGRITSLPWGVKFKDAEGFRHPSQLYESAKNFFIFGVLWFLKDKRFPPGLLFWTFITLYGLLRFLIEFVRQPDSQLGFIFLNLSMGQLLCIPMFLLGSYMIYRLKYKNI